MGKKSKKEKNKQLEDTTAVLSKKSVVRKPRKQRPKATDAGGGTPIGRSSRVGQTREPSDNEIRLRAYFIAERRTLLSLEGDSTHDWIEARRQLIEEGKAARS